MRLAAAFLLIVLPGSAQPLSKKIDAILRSSEPARQTFWGIHVVDAKTGASVYRRNENNFFVPASNTKLFSTALALMRLGPDHRFHTTVLADSKPHSEGRIREIRLVGGGDPNLSGRVIPYKRNETKPNPLEAIDALADAVVQAGVRVIDGDVVGDDTAYFQEPYPDGWAIDDPTWEYGAPVSALTLNDNAFKLLVDPGAVGEPVRLSLRPAFEHLTIHNRTSTIAGGTARLHIERLPGSSELNVWGTVRHDAKTGENILGIEDPALFAAHAFRDALLGRGVRVTGDARSVHRRVDDPEMVRNGVELARHTSHPLIEALRIINKVSQNLHAEIMLLEVARSVEGVGSRKRGLEELSAFLKEIGIADKQYNFEDGSGLSRMTLVTPLTITKLLTFMHGTSHRDAWISTLPIAGQDGTLWDRFDRIARPGITAKTGTISHVSSLSGYALRKNGRRYAFAIMANNYNAPSRDIRKLIDRVALELLK